MIGEMMVSSPAAGLLRNPTNSKSHAGTRELAVSLATEGCGE